MENFRPQFPFKCAAAIFFGIVDYITSIHHKSITSPSQEDNVISELILGQS